MLAERVGLVAAVEARDERRDALAQKVLRQGVVDDRELHVRVLVDEAGRDDEAVGVENYGRLVGGDAVPVDADDALAPDRDVRAEASAAGPVHDGPVLDDDVVAGLRGEEGGEQQRDHAA